MNKRCSYTFYYNDILFYLGLPHAALFIQYIFQVDRKIAGIINSETSTMTVSLKNYTFDSFRNICSDEGMIIEGVYGSYLEKPYEALDPRMIFLLR